MQLVLMMVGRSLLAGLLLPSSLNLWRRLNRCCRNLRLVKTGRSRIKRNQHLLEAHTRDTPRYIPGTGMVLHLRYKLLRTSSHKRIPLDNSNNNYKICFFLNSHLVPLSIMNRTRIGKHYQNSTGSIHTLSRSSHVVSPLERKVNKPHGKQEKPSPTRTSQGKL